MTIIAAIHYTDFTSHVGVCIMQRNEEGKLIVLDFVNKPLDKFGDALRDKWEGKVDEFVVSRSDTMPNIQPIIDMLRR